MSKIRKALQEELGQKYLRPTMNDFHRDLVVFKGRLESVGQRIKKIKCAKNNSLKIDLKKHVFLIKIVPLYEAIEKNELSGRNMFTAKRMFQKLILLLEEYERSEMLCSRTEEINFIRKVLLHAEALLSEYEYPHSQAQPSYT